MTNEIVIDIQRTGFPVKIGTVELWVDSSLENLRIILNIEEIAHQKLKEAQEKAQHIHFPADITVDNLDDEMVGTAFDIKREFLAAQYDVLFGEGTFKKIYKKHPDILALEQTFEVVAIAVSKRIQEQESVRAKETESKKAEYLAKKVQKK